MTTNTHLLVGDDGQPLGVVDMAKVQQTATVFAYELAAASNDPSALDAVVSRTLLAVGPAGFGYVAAAALRFVVADVLDPMLEVAEAQGHPARARLAQAADAARENSTR